MGVISSGVFAGVAKAALVAISVGGLSAGAYFAYQIGPGGARPATVSGSQELRPLLGDANCDGLADSLDAALVLQFEAGFDVFLVGFPDANEDGRITSIDAALILQFEAGLLMDRYAAGCLSTQGVEGLLGDEGTRKSPRAAPPYTIAALSVESGGARALTFRADAFAAEFAADASTPIEVGELEVQIQVQVVYGLD
ncbi:MAG: dockerin type I repeat-containing protein [Chloroflexi bacterium]|nr:dockerin type I repeat-containing protein [Chloroflexota bacterium]